MFVALFHTPHHEVTALEVARVVVADAVLVDRIETSPPLLDLELAHLVERMGGDFHRFDVGHRNRSANRFGCGRKRLGCWWIDLLEIDRDDVCRFLATTTPALVC